MVLILPINFWNVTLMRMLLWLSVTSVISQRIVDLFSFTFPTRFVKFFFAEFSRTAIAMYRRGKLWTLVITDHQQMICYMNNIVSFSWIYKNQVLDWYAFNCYFCRCSLIVMIELQVFIMKGLYLKLQCRFIIKISNLRNLAHMPKC